MALTLRIDKPIAELALAADLPLSLIMLQVAVNRVRRPKRAS
ncbi:hypothetical protein SAMN05216262_10562 [Colwellia chukchiensis]|uniref:Uncharacterized protein n=1 Tax=Colwellia chukchiensis TaxID=641665 RepID=A0A1H7M295_9GAMM|nr:hypothetical protein SAMN05216262_10562 [Colwellia chukchiensis]